MGAVETRGRGERRGTSSTYILDLSRCSEWLGRVIIAPDSTRGSGVELD